MGTLFDQPPRDSYRESNEWLKAFVHELKSIAKEMGISLETLIDISHLVEEKRANDLRVRDGDIKDEQLRGFGDILKEFIGSIETLGDHLGTITDHYIGEEDCGS